MYIYIRICFTSYNRYGLWNTTGIESRCTRRNPLFLWITSYSFQLLKKICKKYYPLSVKMDKRQIVTHIKTLNVYKETNT